METYYFRSFDVAAPGKGGTVFPLSLNIYTDGDIETTEDIYLNQTRPEGTSRWKASAGIVVERTQDDRADEINAEIDRNTYAMIRAWCNGEPEGCEEAFLSLGIATAGASNRYLAYVAQKNGIITAQAALKV